MVLFLLSVAFVVWVGILVMWDIRSRRLPDILTLPGAGVIGIWALIIDPWLLLGGVGWFVLYLSTAGVMGGIGGGDIKFALGLGTVAAAGGVGAWMAAVVGASMVTLVISALLMMFHRPGGAVGRGIPHGPGMALGTCIAVVATGGIGPIWWD